MCSEFGFHHSFDQDPPIFGTTYNVGFFIDFCNDLFSPRTFDETLLNNIVSNTNTVYGGVDIPTDRILFFFGSVDPWHALGKLNTTNKESPVIYVEGASHGADMFDIGEWDSHSPALQDAKYAILDQLKVWID